MKNAIDAGQRRRYKSSPIKRRKKISTQVKVSTSKSHRVMRSKSAEVIDHTNSEAPNGDKVAQQISALKMKDELSES